MLVGCCMFSRESLVELLFVGFSLIIIALLGNGALTDWTASLAVFLGFFHAQLSFDLADESDSHSDIESDSSTALRCIFVLKESVWIVTFLILNSYPLLFGAIIFMTYPVWRKRVREMMAVENNGEFLQ